MSQPRGNKTYAFDRPGNYRIRVLGILDESFSERLGGVRIRQGSLQRQCRTGHGVSRPAAGSGRIGRIAEQSLRAAPGASVRGIHQR